MITLNSNSIYTPSFINRLYFNFSFTFADLPAAECNLHSPMLRFAGNEFYDTLCASQTTFPSAGLSDGGIMTITRPKKKKKRKTKEENKEEKEPRFSVILWNDDVHTFEYVIFMLQTLFGYPARKGLMLASEVHVNGRAIVFTSSLNEAEVKRDQILSFGPDILCADSSGPLIATLERTPE